MTKKKLISVLLVVLMLSATVPAYAAMPDGSLEQIAISLTEGEVKSFKLPDLPPAFTDTFQWINGITVTTTQYKYEPSMWFKIFVPSENQEIEWTLSSVSGSTFTDYISVVITHESDLHTSRCYGFWQVSKNATIAEKITKGGYVYIHLYGKDVTTDFSFSYSLRDYVSDVEEPTVPVYPVEDDITIPTKDELPISSNDNTQDLDTWDELETVPDTEPQINLESASSWAHDAIRSAVTDGYVPSDIQDDYMSVITRAEFCRMAVKWLEYATGMDIDSILTEKGVSRNFYAFSDTNDIDILAAHALGITNGTSSDKFTPDGQFSREQAATMIRNTCRVLGADADNSPTSDFIDLNIASSWAVDGINFCRANGIMNGTSTVPLLFSPKATYTRQESIVTFSNIKLDNLPTAEYSSAHFQPDEQTAVTEPKIESINKFMTVDIEATAQLALCSYREGEFYTTSTWIRKNEEVFVYGVATEAYNGLIMAKVNYMGQDGWVANMWLS